MSFDFSHVDEANRWELTRPADIEISKKGLLIKTKDPVQLWSPPIKAGLPGDSGILWNRFRYIKIELSPSLRERRFVLLWSSEKSRAYPHRLPLGIPKNTGVFFMNTPNTAASDISSVFHEPVSRIGFELWDDFEIKKITLLPVDLPLSDLIRLSAQYLCAPEFFRMFHVNLVLGFEGRMFFYWAALIALGLFFLKWSGLVGRLALSGIFLCYLFLDVPIDFFLVNHAIESSRHSAWHSSKYEERRSRFGKAFADLAAALEVRVPERSEVFFPRERLGIIQGEINWVAFQFYPQYQSVLPEEADYVFYFFPAGCAFDEVQKSLKVSGEREQYFKADVLFDGEKEVKLLKVSRV